MTKKGTEDVISGAPTAEAARAMGMVGADGSEAERLAFEAWVAGHSWTLGADWTPSGYIASIEIDGNFVCPHAMRTRMMWAAWRDRAALAKATPAGRSDLQAAVEALDKAMADYRRARDMLDRVGSGA